jgi:hypothetical protein
MLFSLHTTCPAHVIFLDLIILMVKSTNYEAPFSYICIKDFVLHSGNEISTYV